MKADLIDQAPEDQRGFFSGPVFVKSVAEVADLCDIKVGNVRMEPHRFGRWSRQIIFQFLFIQLQFVETIKERRAGITSGDSINNIIDLAMQGG